MSTVPAELTLELAWSPRPREVQRLELRLPPGATVADALEASGWVASEGWVLSELRVGIWGKARELSTELRERDRIEIYRALLVDPKEARRLRYRQHKEKLQAARAAAGDARAAGVS